MKNIFWTDVLVKIIQCELCELKIYLTRKYQLDYEIKIKKINSKTENHKVKDNDD